MTLIPVGGRVKIVAYVSISLLCCVTQAIATSMADLFAALKRESSGFEPVTYRPYSMTPSMTNLFLYMLKA